MYKSIESESREVCRVSVWDGGFTFLVMVMGVVDVSSEKKSLSQLSPSAFFRVQPVCALLSCKMYPNPCLESSS